MMPLRIVLSAFIFLVATTVLHAAPHDALQKKITSELKVYYPQIPIKVSIAEGGKVTIKGQVPSYWDRRRIHDIVRRFEGITAISNQLEVVTAKLPDDVVKANIRAALSRNSAISDPDKIKIDVTDGLVMLGGQVNFYRESLLAEDVASWAKGVKSVTNQVTVVLPDEKISDAQLQELAMGVVNREFPLQKQTVQLATEGGTVKLDGTVSSLWHRHHMEKSIRRIPGVRHVTNNLKVKAKK